MRHSWLTKFGVSCLNQLVPHFCRRCPLRIFGIMSFGYCTTRTTVHRRGCKEIAVHGFGGSSVGLEASLTSEDAAGKEIPGNVQRTAKCCDDDAGGRDGRLRLVLLGAVIMAVRRALSPQTNRQTSNDKQNRHGAKILAALPRVRIRSSIVCFQGARLFAFKAVRRVQGIGSVFSFSAPTFRHHGTFVMHPLAVLCRICGLDLPTSSTITGMRAAAGGRQPATAKPLGMQYEM